MSSANDATQAVAMLRLGAIELVVGVCVHWTGRRRVQMNQFEASKEYKIPKGLRVVEAQWRTVESSVGCVMVL